MFLEKNFKKKNFFFYFFFNSVYQCTLIPFNSFKVSELKVHFQVASWKNIIVLEKNFKKIFFLIFFLFCVSVTPHTTHHTPHTALDTQRRYHTHTESEKLARGFLSDKQKYPLSCFQIPYPTFSILTNNNNNRK